MNNPASLIPSKLSTLFLYSIVTATALPALANDDPALQLKGNPRQGSLMFNNVCKGCHGVSIAPDLRGVVGREIASQPDYKNYTDAIKALRGNVWTKEKLSEWLTGPSEIAPGTAMVQTIPDSQARADTGI